MLTIPFIIAVAAGSAISAIVTNLVNKGKVRDAYDDGHEAGFKKALGLNAGKRDDAPGGFL